jgi:REP element-mobilizing transposase RayT
MPYREIPLRPSQCFHIYNHANGFENIFEKEENYEYFLKLYTQQEKYLIKQLSLRFGNFFNAYAQAFNKQQKRKGSLFVPNFKRKEVADQQYFINLIHYIHYNPVYHGFCAEPIDWPFSSFQSISSNKPTRLLRDEVLESFGGLHQYQKIHQSPPKLIPEW